MTSSKRLTRQEMQEPDPLLLRMERLAVYVRSHVRLLVGVGLALLLVALGSLGVVGWMRSRAKTESLALAKLVEMSERPVGSAAQPGQEPYPDQASKDNAILEECDAVLRDHAGTVAARGAMMLKAQALARRGRYADAEALFAQLAGNGPTDVLAAAAVLARAEAQAGAGQVNAAVEELKRLATTGNAFLPKDAVLARAAEILERAGEGSEAAKLYERITLETPDSPLLGRARSKLEELAPRNGSPSGAEAAVP